MGFVSSVPASHPGPRGFVRGGSAVGAIGRDELRRGVKAWFFLAMALSQTGDKDQARPWYDRAVDWMEERRPKDPELRRLRDEAAAVLGLSRACYEV